MRLALSKICYNNIVIKFMRDTQPRHCLQRRYGLFLGAHYTHRLSALLVSLVHATIEVNLADRKKPRRTSGRRASVSCGPCAT